MITFLDLIQNDEFRGFVSKRIENSINEPYSFPSEFPLLYRYRSLSTYAIDDIVNCKITLSSIGEFNDIFDGAFHQYGTIDEIEKAAQANWEEMERLRNNAKIPKGLLSKKHYIGLRTNHYKKESMLKFRELNYLGTYVCCFSKDNSSILMWAHYADSNKGICIEYDFNKMSVLNEKLLRSSIFPVAYSSTPINNSDLIDNTGYQVYRYPLDAAVLCTALNKANIWRYEKEWRFVWVLASLSQKSQRMSLNLPVYPSKIFIGYHFLKSFFYFDSKDESEYQRCEKTIKKFMELVSFMKENKINAAVMVPNIGEYQIKPYDIPIDRLYNFLIQHFRYNKPKNMKFYNVLHDRLMELIEKSSEECHNV